MRPHGGSPFVTFQHEHEPQEGRDVLCALCGGASGVGLQMSIGKQLKELLDFPDRITYAAFVSRHTQAHTLTLPAPGLPAGTL